MNDKLSEQKDASILAFLDKAAVSARGWVVVDHWEADRRAIGLAANDEPSRLAYLSTWQKAPGRCYVELEGQSKDRSAAYLTEMVVEDCDYDEALTIIGNHLRREAR
jgi:hypothetical protein